MYVIKVQKLTLVDVLIVLWDGDATTADGEPMCLANKLCNARAGWQRDLI